MNFAPWLARWLIPMNSESCVTLLDTIAFLLVTPEITSEKLLERFRTRAASIEVRARHVLRRTLGFLSDHVMPVLTAFALAAVLVALYGGPDVTPWVGLLSFMVAVAALTPLIVEGVLKLTEHEAKRRKLFIWGATIFLFARGLAFWHSQAEPADHAPPLASEHATVGKRSLLRSSPNGESTVVA